MSYTVEQVAALFWTGDFSQAERLFANHVPPSRSLEVPDIPPKLPIPQQLNLALTLASAEDLAAYDLSQKPLRSRC